MTDPNDKALARQHAIERQKTVRAALWVVALLIVAAILFGVYRVVTAPVRVAQDTTASVAAGVDEMATKVLTARHIEVKTGRRFARLADRAHAVLVALPATEPRDIGERAFRASNLRGARNQVCTFQMDFGDAPVNVFAAADNDDFATNRAMGGEAQRQVRLVFVTDEATLGMSAQFDTNGWQLLWRRRNAARRPLDDDTAAARSQDALARVADECSPE